VRYFLRTFFLCLVFCVYCLTVSFRECVCILINNTLSHSIRLLLRWCKNWVYCVARLLLKETCVAHMTGDNNDRTLYRTLYRILYRIPYIALRRANMTFFVSPLWNIMKYRESLWLYFNIVCGGLFGYFCWFGVWWSGTFSWGTQMARDFRWINDNEWHQMEHWQLLLWISQTAGDIGALWVTHNNKGDL